MDFAPVSKIDTHLHLSLEPMPKISSYLEMLPHLDNQGIEKGIVIVGCYNYAEIWSETAYDKLREEEDVDAMIAELESLGL